MASSVRTVRDDSEAFLGTFGRLVVVVTREAPTVPGFVRFRETLEEQLDAIDGVIDVFVVLRARRPRMDPNVRAMMIELWKRHGERLAFAVWPARSSFAGALQHSFIAALSLLRVSRSPLKVVRSAAMALDFFVEQNPDLAVHREAWLEAIDEALVEPQR